MRAIFINLVVCYLCSLRELRAAPTYPVILNDNDHFACSSEARAMDSNELTTATELLICGVTRSATQMFATQVSKCTDNAVPFVAAFQDSVMTGYQTFFSTVSYPPDGTSGAFTDVLACKMSQRNDWANANTLLHSIVVLKFQALSTQTQPSSMFLAKMSGATLTLSKFINMMDKIDSKEDILLTTFDQGAQDDEINQKIYFINSASTSFKIHTVQFSADLPRNVFEGFTSGNYVSKFGLTALAQIKAKLWAGGTVKLESHTGDDFFPVIVQFDKDAMDFQDSFVLTPNNVPAGTYYSVDMMVQNTADGNFMGLSQPRSSSNAIKAYDAVDPLLLYVVRDINGNGGGNGNGNSGNGKKCSNNVDVMMVKFTTADTYTHSRLLYISNKGKNSIHYWFAQSSSLATLGYAGTSQNSIIHYKLEGTFQCAGTSSFSGTITKVTNDPPSQALAGANNYVCYPDASINKLCYVVDMKMELHSAEKTVYVVNTEYINDASAIIQKQNQANDAQGSLMTGTYIVINGGETDLYLADQATPQIDQFYEATATSYAATFANPIAAESLFDCNGVPYTQSALASYVSGEEYIGQALQVTSSQTMYNSVTMSPPTVFTCTGTADQCSFCFFQASYRLSDTQNTFSQGQTAFVETDLASGKLKLYYQANTIHAMKSYIQSTVPHQAAATLYHQFTILFNVGAEFVYPDCSPWCLYDPSNSSPLSLTNQKPNRDYRSTAANACWKAITDCLACLAANPLSSNSILDGTSSTCPTTSCTGNLISYTAPGGNMLEFSTTPATAIYTVPLTTFIATLSPNNVVPVGVFQLVNGEYVNPPTYRMFTVKTAVLEIETDGTHFFTDEQFYLKYREDCNEPLQNEIAYWDPQADFTSDGFETQYVPFKFTIASCGSQLELTLHDAISIEGLTVIPQDATYTYPTLVFEAGLGTATTDLSQVFEFPSDLSYCYASSIVLCSDSLCSAQISTGPISFQTNPSPANGTGSNKPHLDVLLTAPLSSLVYLKVSDASASFIISDVKIAVCGQETVAPNAIDLLEVPLSSTDSWITIAPESSLFTVSFPQPELSSACGIQAYSYCLDSGCGTSILPANFQIASGYLQILRSYITQSMQVFVQVTTKGLVQSTTNAIICYGNPIIAPLPSYTIQQDYPGSPNIMPIASMLYSNDSLCNSLTFSLTLEDGSALSAEEQRVIAMTASTVDITPPDTVEDYTLSVKLTAQFSATLSNSVTIHYIRNAMPKESGLVSIQEGSTINVLAEVIINEETIQKSIFVNYISNPRADTDITYTLPEAVEDLVHFEIYDLRLRMLLDETLVTPEEEGVHLIPLSIWSQNYTVEKQYTFRLTLDRIKRGQTQIQMALNEPPSFVPIPESYTVSIKGDGPETHVIQLPQTTDALQDTISARADMLQPFMSFNEQSLELTLSNIDSTNVATYSFIIILEDQYLAQNEYVIQLDIKIEDTPQESSETTSDQTQQNENADSQSEAGAGSSFQQQEAEKLAEIASSTFKGVDLDYLRQKQRKASDSEDIPPPYATFMVNVEGICNMHFNQEMIAPNEIIQSDYEETFDFWVISVLDGSQELGTQMQYFRQRQQRKLDDQPESDFTWAQRLSFNAIVLNHTTRDLNLQLEFLDPKIVSSTNFGNDQLLIQIHRPEMFISSTTFKKMTAEVFEGKKAEVLVSLPPIIEDKELAKQIDSYVRRGGDFLNQFTSGNFFLNLLMKGSMQQLWGMIRALQLIFMSSLININQPPHTVLFFKICMVFAQMDILNSEEFYEERLTFKHTEPLTEVFNQYGIENMNFILNSGSFLVLQMLILFYFLGQYYLNKVAVNNYKHFLSRKVGIWAYQVNYKLQFIKASQKLFMESYFDLAMISLLNTVALWRSEDWTDFWEFFDGPQNIINNFIGSVCMVFIVIFPIYSFRIIKKNFGHLQTTSNKNRYLIFYEGIRTNTMVRAQYNNIFLVRRILTVMILVFIDQPFFQVSYLMVFSVINFIYQVTEVPQDTYSQYLIECFNELTILMFSYLFNVILNSATPTTFKFTIGWALLGISCFNVLVNVIVLLVKQTLKIIADVKLKLKIRSYKAKIQGKIDSRKAMCDSCQPEHEHYKEHISIYEAIRYCRSWYPERKWLLRNKIDIKDLQEEQDFMELATEYKLFDKAKNLQLRQTLTKAQKLNDRITSKQEQIQKIRENYQQENHAKRRKTTICAPSKKLSMPMTSKDPKLITIQEIDEDDDTDDKAQSTRDVPLKFTKRLSLRNQIFMKGVKFDCLPLHHNDQINEEELEREGLDELLSMESLKTGTQRMSMSIRDQKDYDLTQQEQHSQVNGDLRQHNPFNLDFMNEEEEEKVEEYSNQLLNMASMSNHEMIDKFFFNKGLCQIYCSGSSCLQAVLQVLLEVQELKAFFVYRNFDENNDTQNPVMSKLGELFCAAYCPIIQEFDHLKEFDIPDSMSGQFVHDDPLTSLIFFIEQLSLGMSIAKKTEFSQMEQDQCIRDSETSGDLSQLRFHFDQVYSNLAAQEFMSLRLIKNECEFHHIYTEYVPTMYFQLRAKATFEETVDSFFKERMKVFKNCSWCTRSVRMQQETKLAILPRTIILKIDSFDEEGGEAFVDWEIPPYHNFKQYFFGAREHWTEYLSANVNYQAFAVITKEDGEYVAMVRKQNYISSYFEWFKFERNRITQVRERKALIDIQPLLIMYRVKPNFKQVPPPPVMELQLAQTSFSTVSIRPSRSKSMEREREKKQDKRDKKDKKEKKDKTDKADKADKKDKKEKKHKKEKKEKKDKTDKKEEKERDAQSQMMAKQGQLLNQIDPPKQSSSKLKSGNYLTLF